MLVNILSANVIEQSQREWERYSCYRSCVRLLLLYNFQCLFIFISVIFRFDSFRLGGKKRHQHVFQRYENAFNVFDLTNAGV